MPNVLFKSDVSTDGGYPAEGHITDICDIFGFGSVSSCRRFGDVSIGGSIFEGTIRSGFGFREGVRSKLEVGAVSVQAEMGEREEGHREHRVEFVREAVRPVHASRLSFDVEGQARIENVPPHNRAVHLARFQFERAMQMKLFVRPVVFGARTPKLWMKQFRNGTVTAQNEGEDSSESGMSWLDFQAAIEERVVSPERNMRVHERKVKAMMEDMQPVIPRAIDIRSFH